MMLRFCASRIHQGSRCYLRAKRSSNVVNGLPYQLGCTASQNSSESAIRHRKRGKHSSLGLLPVGQEEVGRRILWIRLQGEQHLNQGRAWQCRRQSSPRGLQWDGDSGNVAQAIRAVKTISKSQMKNLERFKQEIVWC